MRKLMIVLGMLASAVVVSDKPANAQPFVDYYDRWGNDRGGAWCLRPVYARGDFDCRFYTYEQCMETASGNVGFCEPSPWAIEAQRAQAASPRPYKKPRRQYRDQ